MSSITDLLALQAEIAIGFTGFAALVSALGQSPSEADARLDRLRLRNLVEVGVPTTLMAMLPLVLLQGDFETGFVWLLSSSALIIILFLITFLHGGRNRVSQISEFAGYNRFGAVLIWAFGMASLAVLFLGLFTPTVIRPGVAYVTAVWFMTAVLGVYFVRVASSLLSPKLGGGR